MICSEFKEKVGNMFENFRIEEYRLLRKNIRQKRRELRELEAKKLDLYDVISDVKVNSGDMSVPKFGLHCVITNLYRHNSGVDVCRCPLYLEKEGCCKNTCPGKFANNRYIAIKLQCEQAKQDYETLLIQRRRAWHKLWTREK